MNRQKLANMNAEDLIDLNHMIVHLDSVAVKLSLLSYFLRGLFLNFLVAACLLSVNIIDTQQAGSDKKVKKQTS